MMENEKFTYTYSARKSDSDERLRTKYIPAPEDETMAALRALDGKISSPGTAAGIAVGVVGTLLLGTGMSAVMVWGGVWFVPGILIGLVGIAGIAAAYPMFDRLTKKQREKYAEEIDRLTSELGKK